MTGFLVRGAATAALRHSASSKKGSGKRNRSHLPPGRAILLGAGLMTAGRWLLHGRAGHLTETVQQWVDEVADELEDDEQPEQDFEEEPDADVVTSSEEDQDEVPADA